VDSRFAQALRAFSADDFAGAAALAGQAAAASPSSLLYRAATTYLGRVLADGKAGVYISGEAFAAFIRDGGNVPLYANASAALRAIYGEYSRLSLLEVGVGDGMALLPALAPQITQLDLVEPSAAMLARTRAALDARGLAYADFNGTLQEFAAQPHGLWDVAQATFSLQSLDPDDRRAMLGWLRSHCGRLLIVEFDVPDLGAIDDERRMAHFAERYEQGLAEYSGDGGLVAQGFLMPVFFGYFDRSAARANYEQPIAAWEADLQAASFRTIRRQPIYTYWWAPAHLLDAR
jgi:hypothetical protein